MNCSVYQEIGSHSFSHLLFGDKTVSKEMVRDELRKCHIEAEKKV